MGKYLQVSITYFDGITKKAICNIAKASYLDHTQPLFVQYKCLKFLDIVNFKTLIIIYKDKNNMLPINLPKNVHNNKRNTFIWCQA